MGLNPAQAKAVARGTQTLPNEPFMGKGETMTDPMSLTFLGGAGTVTGSKFLLEHAGSGRFGYLLRSEHEADWDADYGGADGGFELLDPERMRRDHARIRRTTLGPGESWPFVPFVKDPNEATWLCVVRTPEGDRIAHVFHDEAVEEAERWSLDGFFDAWSAAGFRTGPRWEDQPDAIVERFREALGIVEPVDPE